jgi:hypothetical protein
VEVVVKRKTLICRDVKNDDRVVGRDRMQEIRLVIFQGIYPPFFMKK